MTVTGLNGPPWVGLSEFHPLPRFGKIALAGLAVLAATASIILTTAGGGSPLAVALEGTTIGVIALFAWRPPVAAVATLAATAGGMYLEQSSAYAVVLAAIIGLVIYTCSPWLAIIFSVATAALVTSAELLLQDLRPGGAISTLTIGLVSGLVGFSLRGSHSRERDLAADYAKAVQAERDRIADELHNIIAHDLTIVTMHSQALPLVSNQAEQQVMVKAITKSANQALTDIRRMLNIVHDRVPDGPAWTYQDVSAPETLEEIESELKDFGIAVELDVSYQDDVSPTVNTTLAHVAKECATNIMKHAPTTPKVRIRLRSQDRTVSLTFWNASPRSERGRMVRSGGYGLNRMAERVELLGGTMTTEQDEDGWRVTTYLPTS